MFILSVLLSLFSKTSLAQDQDKESGRYRLRNRIASQDTVFIKAGKDSTRLLAGWTLTESKGGKNFQRTLKIDETIYFLKDSAVAVMSNWKIGEVKHTDEAPDKLILNPHHFSDPKDSILNRSSYIKILENGYVWLTRSYFKWNALTIPFAVRPALNDTIGSRVTTDLKIGASFSYNFNWECFRNRRIKAKKTVYGISAGIGFGFSKVTLNSSSTSLRENPLGNEEDGLAFFIGPGVGLNLKGFQVNFSYGWDLPVTSNVKKWNYCKKGYVGLGLGIGLDVFGKL